MKDTMENYINKMLTVQTLCLNLLITCDVSVSNSIFDKCNNEKPFNSSIGPCLDDAKYVYCTLHDENVNTTEGQRCNGNAYLGCLNRNLTCVPAGYIPIPPLIQGQVCTLDLSRNMIDAIPDFAFGSHVNLSFENLRQLYLNENRLRWIASNAFNGLSNLEYMNLTENCLEWKNSFPTGVFMPLVSLLIINLKRNMMRSFIDLDTEFRNMTHLKRLFVNPYNSTGNFTFGLEFQNLVNLTTINLAGIGIADCSVNTIAKGMFDNIPHVQYLSLRECNVTNIDEGALLPLNNSLAELDLSYNMELTFNGMNKALNGLRFSTKLKTLKANMLYSNLGLGVEFKEEYLDNMKTLRVLETLNIDLNKIEVFNMNVFHPESQWPASLSDLTLAGNRLTAGDYVNTVYMAEKITRLDISRQHLNYDPFSNYGRMDEHLNAKYQSQQYMYNQYNIQHLDLKAVDWWSFYTTSPQNFNFTCECDYNLSKTFICLPKHMTSIKWRKSFIYATIPPALICGASQLKSLDMSFNLFHTWKGPIMGLSNLESLDLSENYCTKLEREFFLGFPNLQHLNITGNHLGRSFNPESNNGTDFLFTNLENIRTIDMSLLKIVKLSKILFSNMSELEQLNLSNNYMKTWDTIIRSLCLHHIDLSGNKLSFLPEYFTSYLDTLINSSCNLARNVTLLLGNNPLECSCEQLPFWKWIDGTNVQVYMKNSDTCMLNGKAWRLTLESDFYQVLETLTSDCRDKRWISWAVGSASVLFAILITVCICTLAYKNRWLLRYMYYKRKRRHTLQGFEHLFSNDAMISYAKGQASFIKNNLVPALEGTHQLRLWVADRDSVPGVSVAENIFHAIYSSRKTVLLIDDEYLDSAWCDYDMNIARLEAVESNRNLLIVVMMENVQQGNIPLHVLNILRNERSLEYPDNELYLDTFWTNLALEINS